MIGALKGKICQKRPNSWVILAGEVGYQVYVTPREWDSQAVGDSVFLWVHTHVREDALNLFGFISEDELRLFEMLLGISGVGPKTALGIVGQGVSQVETAVRQADVNFFTHIPRLGTKNAQKVIIELKTKLGSLKDLDLTGTETAENRDLTEALLGFGFTRSEARTAIAKIPTGIVGMEDKLKSALKIIGKIKT